MQFRCYYITIALYFDHSSDPSAHSWTVPIIKITINTIDKIVHAAMSNKFIRIGIGKIKVISTSKIKKITATKKKCSEKGTRAEDFGSYPHSKGEPFSRSIFFFIAITAFKAIKMTDSSILKDVIIIIIFSLIGLFNWKLNLLFYNKNIRPSSINIDV